VITVNLKNKIPVSIEETYQITGLIFYLENL
jgi:hypothetical protein